MRASRAFMKWLCAAGGVPDGVNAADIDALSARLREAYARGQQQEQVGADVSRNIGGHGDFDPLDGIEDGEPILLDNLTKQAQD